MICVMVSSRLINCFHYPPRKTSRPRRRVLQVCVRNGMARRIKVDVMTSEKGLPHKPCRSVRRHIRQEVRPTENRCAIATLVLRRVPHVRRDIEDGGLLAGLELRFGGEADYGGG